MLPCWVMHAIILEEALKTQHQRSAGNLCVRPPSSYVLSMVNYLGSTEGLGTLFWSFNQVSRPGVGRQNRALWQQHTFCWRWRCLKVILLHPAHTLAQILLQGCSPGRG